MKYDFDRIIDRRSTESVKWRIYGEDVLPLWVADMDFVSPQPVVEALRRRVEHGVFGYPWEPPELRPVVLDWIERRYAWKVNADDLVFIPGVVVGFNLAAHMAASPEGGLLVQTPIYPPMLSAAGYTGMQTRVQEILPGDNAAYDLDGDAFESSLGEDTALFLLCNPHNPTGRVFRREELERMAQACLRRKVLICSDEIHCDLIYSGEKHIPIASLSPEVARNTITLIAPSKTFNIAGLEFSVAIIPDPDLRKRYETAQRGLVGHPNLMGGIAALAAYAHGEEWLEQVLTYLEGNRDYLAGFVRDELPGVRMTTPQGTYLAWLDCRALDLPEGPFKFFLKQARVALNDGIPFGRGGEGFVRLNFGCPRPTLVEALKRMKQALLSLHS